MNNYYNKKKIKHLDIMKIKKLYRMINSIHR